jgi:hypothetical protein
MQTFNNQINWEGVRTSNDQFVDNFHFFPYTNAQYFLAFIDLPNLTLP